MSKRLFRRTPEEGSKAPTYPTLEEFDQNRRSFLWQLGAAILGSSVISAVLVSCDGRPVTLEGDGQPPWDPADLSHIGGVRVPDDARIDMRKDAGVDALAPKRPDITKRLPDLGQPDSEITAGVAPMPDSRVDIKPPEPDIEVTMGEDTPPDARIDSR
jgi:hypothetical protein